MHYIAERLDHWFVKLVKQHTILLMNARPYTDKSTNLECGFFFSITVRIRVHSHARETEPATKEQTLKSKIFFGVFIKRYSDGFAKHDELWSADHAILNQNLYFS